MFIYSLTHESTTHNPRPPCSPLPPLPPAPPPPLPAPIDAPHPLLPKLACSSTAAPCSRLTESGSLMVFSGFAMQ